MVEVAATKEIVVPWLEGHSPFVRAPIPKCKGSVNLAMVGNRSLNFINCWLLGFLSFYENTKRLAYEDDVCP